MDFSKLSRSELLDFVSPAGLHNRGRSLAEQAQELFNKFKVDPNMRFPIPVVDLYLSSIYDGPRDVIYTREDILNLSEEEIRAFDELFQFNAALSTSEVNQQRILRILKYLNLLDRPEAILFEGEIRENLCESLDLADLNTLRLALDLTVLPCPITVVGPGEEEEYRDRQIFIPAFVPSSVKSVHFNQVDDFTAELAASIQENGVDWTLIDQAQKGNYRAVDFLIKVGADVNHYSGQTPLTAATDPAVVELLLKAGANPNLDGQWSYPLYDASPEKTQLLLQYGADPNHRDERFHEGRTALMNAILKKDAKIIYLYFNHKPIKGQPALDLNVTDEKGATALLYALENKHIKLAQKLIERGADPNHRGTDGQTPLFYAVRYNDVETARSLLGLGANPNYADRNRLTPLMSAVSLGELEMARLLLESGANPKLRGADRDTAWEIAHERGDRDMINLLEPYQR